MQDILRALPAVLKHFDPEGDAVEPVVFAAWRRVLEGTLIENIVPLRLEKNRLFAAVSDETWCRQVADLGPTIAERINKAVGAKVVNFIEFQIDSAAVEEHKKNLARDNIAERERSRIAEELRKDLESASGSISDEQLRETFLSAAAGSLARNKLMAESCT